jgi:hypothetical protein
VGFLEGELFPKKPSSGSEMREMLFQVCSGTEEEVSLRNYEHIFDFKKLFEEMVGTLSIY